MKEKVELEKNLEEYKLANNTIKKAHEDLKKEYVSTFNENEESKEKLRKIIEEKRSLEKNITVKKVFFYFTKIGFFVFFLKEHNKYMIFSE